MINFLLFLASAPTILGSGQRKWPRYLETSFHCNWHVRFAYTVWLALKHISQRKREQKGRGVTFKKQE